MKPVSVIIPTYNMAHYICEAIESVLLQTYQDYEIIVVDDGSTDHTRETLKQYDNKITYIYQENGGINSARRRGLNEAEGKYFTLIDADDKWLPDKLWEQVEFMEVCPELDLVFSDFYNFNENGPFKQTFLDSNGIFRKILTSPASERHPDWRLFDQNFLYEYLAGNFILPSTLMARKEVCIKYKMWESDLMPRETYEFFLRSLHQLKTGFIDRALVQRRIHGANLTFSNPEEYYKKTILVYSAAKNYPWMDERCRRFLKKGLNQVYFKLGKYYFLKGNFREARGMLKQSFKKYFCVYGIILFCLTFLLSPGIILFTKKAKKSIAAMIEVR